MKFIDIGPLQGLIVSSPGDTTALTLVLLHGYGASGSDLVGLASQLSSPAGLRFVFLQAPIALDAETRPGRGARAWWPLDMLELQTIRSTREYQKLTNQSPPGIDGARAKLGEALDALVLDHGVDRTRLVLGGFSQGAMLSTDFALRDSSPLAGLVVLSGSLISEPAWTKLLPQRRNLPVFQSHSPDDQVLPYPLATRLAELMSEAGLKHQFVQFRGGHGISAAVLEGLGRFLLPLSL